MGTEGTRGRVGRAREFDGAADRMVADTVVGSAADLTFELWMRSDVEIGYHRPIEKIASTGTQGWSVLQRPGTDTFPHGLIFRIGAESSYGGWGNEVSASDVYSVDTWEHVVGTYDSATNTGRLYVNGVEVDSVVNSDGRGVANTTEPLLIGSADGPEPFDGRIDEVRISTVARSATYVSAQYESQNDDFIQYGSEMPVGLACPE
ncbi:MAG: LamG domain-containing protein [Actinobacteria bacterium]|nr:LamG domain-containing protein [Actinomycetota bacterium]